ncbi:MAG TPA: hypothetical protein VF862_14390 [Gemmatimonadales bacterium]
MSVPAGHSVRRLLAALLLGAFLVTGSGTAGLELAWHLAQANDQHASTPHFEAAGGTAHADHCQLGLSHAVGRLPADAPARFPGAPLCLHASACPSSHSTVRPPATGFPRAPPALG